MREDELEITFFTDEVVPRSFVGSFVPLEIVRVDNCSTCVVAKKLNPRNM
jgi:hypothetical protein